MGGPALLLVLAAAFELRTSALEARLFARWSRSLTWVVGPGPSPAIVFPTYGPFDQRRGYTRIPEFVEALAHKGFEVRTQARFSEELVALARRRVNLPYEENTAVGLVIRASDGQTLFDATPIRHRFRRYEEIPPLVVSTLLFLENRELGMPASTTKNPAVEWDRLARAGILYLGRKLGLPWQVQGGSTLAVQLEKYRHSESGRTETPSEKLRQVLSASLKAYRDGPNTVARRRAVVLDYLNTMPLGAARGWGELHGLGEGLHAWFGLDIVEVAGRLRSGALDRDTAAAYKHALALMIAVKAPTTYLSHNQTALEARIDAFLPLLAAEAILDPAFARLVAATPLRRLPEAPKAPPSAFTARKGVNLVRTRLARNLDVAGMYDLDRLHLEVDTSLDARVQDRALELFANLRDPEFVAANGLAGKHLLAMGDPSKVLYSLLLVERTDNGNLVRAHVDSLEQPFDLNAGMKLELGSTGKLRTLAHYLDVVNDLHAELAPLTAEQVAERTESAVDPITRWAAETLLQRPAVGLPGLLDLALERRYSASPHDAFFTGGGEHRFHNFDASDNGLNLSVREATWRSTNLVFIRLMRDLVAYHSARLPYDAHDLLENPDHPQRRALLEEEADAEARFLLFRSYREMRGLAPLAVERKLLGSRADSPRHLAILFFAWHGPESAGDLGDWLEERVGRVDTEDLRRLVRSFGRPNLGLLDHAYLLDRHPMQVWCAGVLEQEPGIAWRNLLERSEAARRESSQWLFRTRQRRAQDLRLRIRVEKDAFRRMTPAWQRLGFPFDRLVPSLATAIGASGDRPTGLADLMGVLVNDGVRLPLVVVNRLSFAQGTPYATHLARRPPMGERVMEAEAARALTGVLTGVVERGTAGRLAGIFRDADGRPLPVGGKTGSGDNRVKTFSRGGEVLSAEAVNRTAGFVFFVGDRLFGVLTAYVPGEDAEGYRFTSSLPVAVLKLLAPSLEERLLRSDRRGADAAGVTAP